MPLDPDTAIGGSLDRFPSTRHSLLEAASADAPLAVEALDRVAALYWKPAYKYLRLKWRMDNEAAKDLTQSFFASAIERDFFQRYDPQKASFRTYLRMALDRFAANEHAAATRQKRGGGVEFEPVEDQAIATDSPDKIFEREWRRQLFALAIEDLRSYCESTGKQVQFRIFEGYDLADAERPSYAELAVQYGIAETSVTNYLAWARRLLRGFVTERLRGLTSGERELRDELRRVWT
jgi:RNA polymerase sigma factor (sigma-70 family)